MGNNNSHNDNITSYPKDNINDNCIITDCQRPLFEDYFCCYLHLILNNESLLHKKTKTYNEHNTEQNLIKELSLKYIDYDQHKKVYGTFNEDEYKFFKKFCRTQHVNNHNKPNLQDCDGFMEMIYPFGINELI